MYTKIYVDDSLVMNNNIELLEKNNSKFVC